MSRDLLANAAGNRTRPSLRSRLLPRGARVDGQRMYAARKFGGEHRIDHAVALDPALSAEGLRHDINPEVGLAARPMSGMALVPLGLVDDPQAFGPESFGQLPCDGVRDVHGPGLVGADKGHGQSRGGANRNGTTLSSLRRALRRPHNHRP